MVPRHHLHVGMAPRVLAAGVCTCGPEVERREGGAEVEGDGRVPLEGGGVCGGGVEAGGVVAGDGGEGESG